MARGKGWGGEGQDGDFWIVSTMKVKLRRENCTGIISSLIGNAFVSPHYHCILIGFEKYAFFRLKNGN